MSASGASGRPEATSVTPTASSRRHPPGPISPIARPGTAPGRSSRPRANASSRSAAASSDLFPPTRTLSLAVAAGPA
jgi:hypothetical protein